jgi:serine/threonine protein kinase
VALKSYLYQYNSEEEFIYIDHQRLKDFTTECKALAAMKGNRLFPQIWGAFCDDQGFHIAMEFVEGMTLGEFRCLYPQKKVPFAKVRLIIVELLLALKSLQAKNIIHRDIKSENVLMRNEQTDKSCSLVLGDLGLCQLQSLPSVEGGDQSVRTCGTPGFMDPDTLNCEAPYSFKSDIFSLGCLAF